MTDIPNANVGGIVVHNPYGLRRRRKGERASDIHDPAIRSRCISLASTGVSRRTVAHLLGKPESTVRGWIERGLAYPTIEPWGSFAEDYMRAERGLAAAIGSTVALRAQVLHEQMQAYADWSTNRPPPPKPPAKPRKPKKGASAEERMAWELASEVHAQLEAEHEQAMESWKQGPPLPDVTEMLWLEKVRISRHPEDYGTSKHRRPDVEHDGNNWLDAHSMDREQLAALFADPPEVMRNALCDAGPAVYRILLSGGFDPAAPIAVDADAVEE